MKAWNWNINTRRHNHTEKKVIMGRILVAQVNNDTGSWHAVIH